METIINRFDYNKGNFILTFQKVQSSDFEQYDNKTYYKVTLEQENESIIESYSNLTQSQALAKIKEINNRIETIVIYETANDFDYMPLFNNIIVKKVEHIITMNESYWYIDLRNKKTGQAKIFTGSQEKIYSILNTLQIKDSQLNTNESITAFENEILLK